MKPEEAREAVLKAVEELEAQDKRGAGWNLLVKKLAEQGMSREEMDEAIMGALDDGLLHEPQIGRIKRVKGLFDWN